MNSELSRHLSSFELCFALTMSVDDGSQIISLAGVYVAGGAVSLSVAGFLGRRHRSGSGCRHCHVGGCLRHLSQHLVAVYHLNDTLPYHSSQLLIHSFARSTMARTPKKVRFGAPYPSPCTTSARKREKLLTKPTPLPIHTHKQRKKRSNPPSDPYVVAFKDTADAYRTNLLADGLARIGTVHEELVERLEKGAADKPSTAARLADLRDEFRDATDSFGDTQLVRTVPQEGGPPVQTTVTLGERMAEFKSRIAYAEKRTAALAGEYERLTNEIESCVGRIMELHDEGLEAAEKALRAEVGELGEEAVQGMGRVKEQENALKKNLLEALEKWA
ncbi:hypothetical protein EJ06DRAFT_82173 [Trichodelitschia bisporula]|uniref:Uncharacterized protein n=1 Tax=Trichodelitschia bisporula TaxID=703511 RepID=A0A6G1HTF4_9PEZI|nr:hypothetical protein EJ06DRAFT_82173 [Trichodelitschia bisporula]